VGYFDRELSFAIYYAVIISMYFKFFYPSGFFLGGLLVQSDC
jgi:hypothetical protein